MLLHSAVGGRHAAENVELLLSRDADPNGQEPGSLQTPLMRLMDNNELSPEEVERVARQLVKANADTNLVDSSGSTSLVRALKCIQATQNRFKYPASLHLMLIEAAADVNFLQPTSSSQTV